MRKRIAETQKLNGMYGMLLGGFYLAGLGIAIGAPNIAHHDGSPLLECRQADGPLHGNLKVVIERRGDHLEANVLRRVVGGLSSLALSQGTFPVTRVGRQPGSSHADSAAIYRDVRGGFELQIHKAHDAVGPLSAELQSSVTGPNPISLDCDPSAS